MEIAPLDLDTWPALATLFSAGGDPKWCWCQFWRKPGSNWSNTSAEENRRDLELLADGRPAPGLIALRDGVAVGWVGLGPKEAFPRLERSRVIPNLPGDGAWSINCFVVARTARRSGVATALLEAAVAYAAEHGATLVEGYPVATAGARIASASVYTGTAGMFERAGFEVAAETASKASGGTPRVLVRKRLRGAGSGSSTSS
ncbi:MAG TPA: GNAT family N-acetyltransferase [Candidatus Limnocylindrales bacterium]|nr:GNAT family N-acetyltransferase [Candidatus Limnocylindrales bacterium]